MSLPLLRIRPPSSSVMSRHVSPRWLPHLAPESTRLRFVPLCSLISVATRYRCEGDSCYDHPYVRQQHPIEVEHQLFRRRYRAGSAIAHTKRDFARVDSSMRKPVSTRKRASLLYFYAIFRNHSLRSTSMTSPSERFPFITSAISSTLNESNSLIPST